MDFLRKLTAALLLALWLPVTQHCGIEAAGLVSTDHANGHTLDCRAECSCDSCPTVEDGNYRPSDSLVKVAPLGEPACVFLVQITWLAACDTHPLKPRESFDRPRDWVPNWTFVRRAAPPSRAPTLSCA